MTTERKKNVLSFEALEGRDLPSATLIGGVLFDFLRGPGVHRVSVDRVGTQVQVVEDGQTSLFDAASVQAIYVKGADAAGNIVQNNTGIASALIGGDQADTLFGGTGFNYIDPVGGDDLVYAIIPRSNNVINAGGEGRDFIFSNFGSFVNAGPEDQTATFFAPGRTPGSAFIGTDPSLNDGTLYITPGNGGSQVFLLPGEKKGDVVALYDLGDGQGQKAQTFSGVSFISYFGGAGNDIYQNNTDTSEAAYGSAGDDVLVGGRGERTLLKGSGGDDVLVLQAGQNDGSANSGRDRIFFLRGGPNVARIDAADLAFGLTAGDAVLSP